MESARATALDLAKGIPPSPKAIERLSREVGDEAARWAFAQWELRKLARSKFERAEQMLFTREALEQATREEIARYHASRFPLGATVADLTCGIGADLLSLAKRGPAVGYELDAERAACARHNLKVLGLNAEVHVQDSLLAEWPAYVWADPARRQDGRRTLDPSGFSPDPAALASRMAGLNLGGIKLTPLLKDAFLDSLGPELAFLASGDECPEAVIWVGREANPGRYAVQVATGEKLDADGPPPYTEVVQDYLYEAHPAAIRAHSLGTLCEIHGLASLGDSNGYLTGSIRCESVWLTRYRVLGTAKADIKALKEELRKLGSGTPVVKSRAAVDVDAVRKSLKLAGDRPLVLAAYPVGKSVRYAILEPDPDVQ